MANQVDHETVSLLLTRFKGECVVAFEPEGATHTLRHGDAFTVVISGRGSGQVEVMHEPDGVTVGAWSGAATSVRNRAGEELPT